MLLAASPCSCHRAVLEQLRRFRRARARERGQGAECTYVKVSCVPRKLSGQTTPSASKSRARPARAKASFACAGRPEDGGSSVVELDPLPLENGRRLPKHIRGVRVLLARAQVRLCELLRRRAGRRRAQARAPGGGALPPRATTESSSSAKSLSRHSSSARPATISASTSSCDGRAGAPGARHRPRCGAAPRAAACAPASPRRARPSPGRSSPSRSAPSAPQFPCPTPPGPS